MARKRSKPAAEHVEEQQEPQPADTQLPAQPAAVHEDQLAETRVSHPLPAGQEDEGVPLYPSTPPELIDPLPAKSRADPFEVAIAARAAGQFEPAPPVESPPPTGAAHHLGTTGHDHIEASKHVRREPPVGGFTSRVEKQPDPFAEYRINLSRDDGGPAMRLYRNRYSNLVAIRFDEKPSDQVRAQLQEGGFSWRSQDRVWAKPLGQRPGEEHRRAQELFETLANQIRAENGMPPIEKIGLAV